MVEILCPHCDGEIELDDDASGEFACPYCEGEFEWNVERKPKRPQRTPARSQREPHAGARTIGQLNGRSIGRELVHFAMLAFVLYCLSGPSMYVVEYEGEGEIADFTTKGFSLGIEGEFEASKTPYSEVVQSLETIKEECLFNGGGGCEFFDEALKGFERWSLASNIYAVLIGLSACCLAASFVSRGLVALVANGRLVMSDAAFLRSLAVGRFAAAPAGALWFLATVLFVLITPSFENTYGYLFEGLDDPNLNTSYTIAMWGSLLMSVVMTAAIIVFFSSIPVEMSEPVEQPLHFVSLVALASSVLCGLGMVGSFFFNWLVMGEFVGVRPTGISISIFDERETVTWWDVFSELELTFIGLMGMLFFLLVLATLISQVVHTVTSMAVQLDDMGVVDMSVERYNQAYWVQIPTAVAALAGTVASYVMVQLTSLFFLSNDVVKLLVGEAIPRPSGMLGLLVVMLIVQFVFRRAYQAER